MAESGDAKARYYLGSCYECGYGTEENRDLAFDEQMKSAEEGYVEAQRMAGFGCFVKFSFVETARWFRLAAGKGYAPAQCWLGYCYYSGQGVNQSDTEAAKWFKLAAEKGYVQAEWRLGACYQEGHGVTQSDSEAIKWYRKAAGQGDRRAVKSLEKMGLYP